MTRPGATLRASEHGVERSCENEEHVPAEGREVERCQHQGPMARQVVAERRRRTRRRGWVQDGDGHHGSSGERAATAGSPTLQTDLNFRPLVRPLGATPGRDATSPQNSAISHYPQRVVRVDAEISGTGRFPLGPLRKPRTSPGFARLGRRLRGEGPRPPLPHRLSCVGVVFEDSAAHASTTRAPNTGWRFTCARRRTRTKAPRSTSETTNTALGRPVFAMPLFNRGRYSVLEIPLGIRGD